MAEQVFGAGVYVGTANISVAGLSVTGSVTAVNYTKTAGINTWTDGKGNVTRKRVFNREKRVGLDFRVENASSITSSFSVSDLSDVGTTCTVSATYLTFLADSWMVDNGSTATVNEGGELVVHYELVKEEGISYS